jgi:hypothetical protein
MPFAVSGNKTVIPPDQGDPGRAYLPQGFPPETQLPLSQGGIAPNRLDFNGILYMLSAFAFWQQSGGQWTYRATLNYAVPCIVYHEGKLWWCLAGNGPDTTVVTPGTNPDYWQDLLSALAGMMSGGGGSSIFGNPPGTIIMYYGTAAPDGYLACDGAAFSASSYPLLYALLGKATTPDMRGLFVRGRDPAGAVDPDGAARAVGSKQTDAGRPATGSVSRTVDNRDPTASGVFSIGADTGNAKGSGGGYALNFDISRAWGANHTAPEFRPANICLLYCIKHD